MKKVMEVLSAAVGFLLLATLIILTITYFNRGKDVVTKNADGVLSVVENADAGAIDIEKYDGESVQGSVVISIIESLPGSNATTPILVYTSKGAAVAEYTKTGATLADNINFAAGAYAASDTKPVEATKSTGNYRVKTDTTYINPVQFYTVKCHYTANKALAFVSITQNN